ncbi:MAG TPA: hypothetical protein VJS92_08500 [Candidatus Polarisedimenticolaceae bacterium]|nr:hypothetical protein [Candidatus Polarisedimenticolaceae bacterium]
MIAQWPLKLLALALAFALWVAVGGRDRVVQDFTVPVEVSLPPDRALASLPPPTALVRLSGPESLLRRLDPVRLAARIELQDAATGRRDVVLAPSSLSGVPRGVDVEVLEPQRFALTVEQRSTRDVPVEPAFLGRPAEGLAFYGAWPRPPRLSVEGPEGELRRLEALRTAAIRLDRHDAAFTERVLPVLDNPHLKLLDLQPIDVDVDIDVAPVELTFQRVPVVLKGGSANASVTPLQLSVTLSGPPQTLQRLDAAGLRAVVDVAALPAARGGQAVAPKISLPAELSAQDVRRVSVKALRPRRVTVRVAGRRSGG